MSDINLILSVTREEQVAIEEYCINSGLSISQYFLGLHSKFQIEQVCRIPKKCNSKEENPEQSEEADEEDQTQETPKRKKNSK